FPTSAPITLLFFFYTHSSPLIYTLSLHDALPISWYFIKETQGVIGFVGGEPPTPTPAEEVESIKTQISASEEHEKPKVSFEIGEDRKSTRLNSSHRTISYAVFCLKKKIKNFANL